MIRKLFLSFLAGLVLFTSIFAAPVKAQSWYLQDYSDWHRRVYDQSNPEEIFGERYTAAQVEWIIYGIIAFIFNHVIDSAIITCALAAVDNNGVFSTECISDIGDIIRNLGIEGTPPTQEETGSLFNPNTASNNFFAVMNNQFSYGLSGVGYVREKLANLHIVPEAKAQQLGFGFGGAGAVRGIWITVRNTTYFFLVLAIIAMAFMIMFRVKLSPQTVITVQSVLPKIIITLLLITFSYAIAGFMIDLMYVVYGILAAILSNSGLFQGLSTVPGADTWVGMYQRLTGAYIGYNAFALMLAYLIAFTLISFLALASNVLGFIGYFLGGTQIVWLIIVVVAVIMIILLLLRTLWMLVKTFVSILLLIAASPILILLGVLGGGGFKSWLQNLAGHLAVFPTVSVMFALSFLFLASALPTGTLEWMHNLLPFSPVANSFENSTEWIPPYLPFGGDMDLIYLFASLVVLTLIPRAADMIRSLIQGRPFDYGNAIGGAVTGAIGFGLGLGEGILAERQRRHAWEVEAYKLSREGAEQRTIEHGRRSSRLGGIQDRIQRARRTFGL